MEKLLKFSKMCFITTKETALAPFNLAHAVYLLIMQIMQIRSFVCHQRAIGWLAQQRRNACGCEWAVLLGHADHGYPRCFLSINLHLREIYASGGGLLVAPINIWYNKLSCHI